jgi:hypothetical protein
MFAPLIDEIREAFRDPGRAHREPELRKIEDWVQLSFKFGNYARRSLLSGEEAIDALWQPGIRNNLLTFLGRSFYKTIATTHLLILTDRELIIIREDETGRHWRDDSRYGGVWIYLPLGKIISVTLAKADANLLALSICLPQNDRIESLFLAVQQPAIDRFLNQIERVTSRIAVTGTPAG